MKRTKAGVLLLAGILCMLSIVLLLCGMSLWAETEGSGLEQIEQPEISSRNDILSAVIEGSVSIEELEKEFAFVPILLLSDYEQEISHKPMDHIFHYSVPERVITKEEAGLRGLDEIKRSFAEDMDGMYLVMKYDMFGRAEAGLWRGYLTDGGEEEKASSLRERRSYTFEVNALTGEVLMVRRVFTGYLPEDSSDGEALSEEELIERAGSYAGDYKLADITGAEARIGRGYDIWGNTYASDGTLIRTEQIVFAKGDEKILGILTEQGSGKLLGYCYDLARRERGELLTRNVLEQITFLKEEIEYMKQEREAGAESQIEMWEEMVETLEGELEDDWNFWE